MYGMPMAFPPSVQHYTPPSPLSLPPPANEPNSPTTPTESGFVWRGPNSLTRTRADGRTRKRERERGGGGGGIGWIS